MAGHGRLDSRPSRLIDVFKQVRDEFVCLLGGEGGGEEWVGWEVHWDLTRTLWRSVLSNAWTEKIYISICVTIAWSVKISSLLWETERSISILTIPPFACVVTQLEKCSSIFRKPEAHNTMVTSAIESTKVQFVLDSNGRRQLNFFSHNFRCSLSVIF